VLISRETYKAIDPNNAGDRNRYQGAVIDEAVGSKREFVADPDFGGWLNRNIRPVVTFRWGLDGWVKRLRMEPFCD
jgi:hypothetical protein